jgi:hypothetical protein
MILPLHIEHRKSLFVPILFLGTVESSPKLGITLSMVAVAETLILQQYVPQSDLTNIQVLSAAAPCCEYVPLR